MKAPKAEKGPSNPLFEKKPKVFGIGQALPPKTPLNRYVCLLYTSDAADE